MFVYGVETSVYVHLTEERGYYLVFRFGELRQRDKYRNRDNIYCSRRVDCAIYRVRCRCGSIAR